MAPPKLPAGPRRPTTTLCSAVVRSRSSQQGMMTLIQSVGFRWMPPHRTGPTRLSAMPRSPGPGLLGRGFSVGVRKYTGDVKKASHFASSSREEHGYVQAKGQQQQSTQADSCKRPQQIESPRRSIPALQSIEPRINTSPITPLGRSQGQWGPD